MRHIDLRMSGWEDYKLLDFGYGRRLEKYGPYTLVRPDPEAQGENSLDFADWKKADAEFDEEWKFNKEIPEKWPIAWEDIKGYAMCAPFKHTGMFPEQSMQWHFMRNTLRAAKKKDPSRPLKVLNLFAYTGMASLAAAKEGAAVTHVDSAKKAITRARENQELSGLKEAPIRWILEDALKFAEREVKRGNKYDGFIMDPPAYGHGPDGEVWNFHKSFARLMELSDQLLSDQPVFFVLNAYAIERGPEFLGETLEKIFKTRGGRLEYGELMLETQDGRALSTGIYARWAFNTPLLIA
jgi:23S rRNA (cytosine1962-C5)-methyltransferase